MLLVTVKARFIKARWAIGGGSGSPLDWNSVFIGIGVIIVVMILGLAYFRRTEKTFADII